MSNEQNIRSWRDEAMSESLRGFNYGENLDALMNAINRAEPALSLCVTWPNRDRALDFLNHHCQNARSLLCASTVSVWEEDRFAWCDWYEANWNGSRFEVVFVPGHNASETVCLGARADALEQFARALESHALRPDKRALRYSEGWESAPDLDAEIGKTTWNDITLPPALLASVRESIETFFAHKEAIQAFGFPWKRGVLLVGPPGTGKTMICKAAAAALPDLPFLYVRDLRERNSKESIEAIFTRARKLAPCILAMEDLDTLINEGNRSIFLNEMDGFQSNEGILIIASSNHPGKIDEALLKRPSRFDRVFHLGLPKAPERRAFCEKILTRESLASKLAPGFDVAALSERVAAKTDGFTPAYLKEAFFSAALSCAQNGALVLDETFVDAVLAQVAELKSHLKKAKNPDAMAEMKSDDDMIGLRR